MAGRWSAEPRRTQPPHLSAEERDGEGQIDGRARNYGGVGPVARRGLAEGEGGEGWGEVEDGLVLAPTITDLASSPSSPGVFTDADGGVDGAKLVESAQPQVPM